MASAFLPLYSLRKERIEVPAVLGMWTKTASSWEFVRAFFFALLDGFGGREKRRRDFAAMRETSDFRVTTLKRAAVGMVLL